MKDLWNGNKFYSILFVYSPTFILSTLSYKTVHFKTCINFLSCRLWNVYSHPRRVHQLAMCKPSKVTLSLVGEKIRIGFCYGKKNSNHL